MKLYISKTYKASADFNLLGYVGEKNARTIEVDQPTVEGADTYRLRFCYADNVVYDVPITGGKYTVEQSVLRAAGYVSVQWLATKTNDNGYTLVAKSDVITLRIDDSIGDSEPVPTPEQALDALDKMDKKLSDAADVAERIKGIDEKITVIKDYADSAKTSAAKATESAENVEGYAESAETYMHSSESYAKQAEDNANKANNNVDMASHFADMASKSSATAEKAVSDCMSAKTATESAQTQAVTEYNKALELSQNVSADIQEVKGTVSQVAQNTADIGKVAATDSAQSQSVDGNNVINIDNAIGVGVKSLVVYGNSTIDGTPSVDNPAAISHCDVSKVSVSDGTNAKEFSVSGVELRGNAQYGRDTLDIITGKITRCTKVKTFTTATANYKVLQSAVEGMSVVTFYTQYVLQDSNIKLYTCDKLPVLTGIKPTECTEQGIYCDGFNIYFIIDVEITTVDEFKTWIAANPITIEYVTTKKVTTESINPSSITLFDGKNIVSNNCNAKMSISYAVDSTLQTQKMIDDFTLPDGAVDENCLDNSIKTKINQFDGVDYRTAEFDYKTYNGADLKTSNMSSKTTGNAPTFTVASTAVTCVIDESESTGVGWAQLQFDFYNTQIPVRRSYNRLMRVDYTINDGTDDFTFNVSGINYGFDTLIDVDKTVGNHIAYIYLSGYQQSEAVNIQIGCNAGTKVSITINSISWIYDSTQKYQIDNTIADNIEALGKSSGKYKFFVAPNANFAMLSSKSDVADKLSTTFAGKKIVYYGDSITAMGGWTDTVSKYFGMTAVNLGIAGTTASGTADNCGVSDTRINQIPTDAAIVTVLFGANDYGASKGIGTLPDEPFTTTTTFDGTTYIGALAEIIRKITLRVPTARIILMCPSWRSGDKDGNEDSKNNNGNTIIDYGNAVKTVGRRLGCPVIDLYNDMGVNVFNRSTCFPEGSFPVHPGNEGRKRIAGLVINEIKKFDL